MKILKPFEVAEQLNVSVKTLQRWDRDGILEAERTPTDRRYYTQEQINDYMNKNKDVSSMNKNFYEELNDQIGYLEEDEEITVYQIDPESPDLFTVYGIKSIQVFGENIIVFGAAGAACSFEYCPAEDMDVGTVEAYFEKYLDKKENTWTLINPDQVEQDNEDNNNNADDDNEEDNEADETTADVNPED